MILLLAGTASGGHFLPAYRMGKLLRYNGRDVQLAVFGKNNYYYDDWIQYFDNISSFKRFLHVHRNKIDTTISFGSRDIILPSLTAKKITGRLWIHEQNVIPGKANKLLMYFADKILLSFYETDHFLPSTYSNKIHVVGYPVDEYTFNDCDDKQFKKQWGIPEDKKIILLMGGSKGSVEINTIASVVYRNIHDRKIDNIFIIWQRGGENTLLYSRYGISFGFSTEIGCFEKIADLIIARGGAGTIAELTYLGKNAILIPLRGLALDHQYFNAVYSGFPVFGIDSLVFDTIYDALMGDLNIEQGRLKIMDYASIAELLGGREKL